MESESPNPFVYTASAVEEANAPVPSPQELRGVAVWPVFVIYLATMLACVIVQIPVVLMWFVISWWTSKGHNLTAILSSPAGFISLAAPSQLCFFVSWWLATRYADRRLVGLRPLGSTTLRVWAYPCLAVGSLALLQLGSFLADGLKLLIGDWDSDLVPDLYKNLDLPTGIVLVAFIGLVPPVVEELFFRGYMQRRLLARWSPWVALPVVGFLFAISHGAPGWAVTVLPWGIWVGVMGWRTGSLWPGIVTHAFVNGGINAWRVGASSAPGRRNGPMPRSSPAGAWSACAWPFQFGRWFAIDRRRQQPAVLLPRR